MIRKLSKISLTAVVALGVLVGCASHSTDSATVSPSEPPGYEPHNTADVAFTQQMVSLQQEAIALSDTLLAKEGIAPGVVDLAKEIKPVRASEITQMQGWLKSWGNPPAVAGEADVSELPSDQHVAQLQAAEGVEATRFYLNQMIANNEKGLALSKTEIDDGQYRATITMARANQVDQQQEITTMKSILDTL